MAVTICVVDDDDDVRGAISLLLRSAGHRPRGFSSAAEFLAECPGNDGYDMVLDVNMPDISGIELLGRLAARGALPPVIILTGYADVPLAVKAMKLGALDFLEKPFSDDALLERVDRAAALLASRTEAAQQNAGFAEALRSLTQREREVMDGIVAGKANKVVAVELGISERTVEIHRGRVMKKLEVRSVAELVSAVMRMAPVPPG